MVAPIDRKGHHKAGGEIHFEPIDAKGLLHASPRQLRSRPNQVGGALATTIRKPWLGNNITSMGAYACEIESCVNR
jgi:hypothetical protein